MLVRPGKPAGRGLKTIQESPCLHLARELGLPVHQRDTFTGWTLPYCGHVSDGGEEQTQSPTSLIDKNKKQFNLIIAVSFGLFVPSRVLNSVKYGGLNVHPSLLPDLPGPAPIPWTILAQRPVTGVTLQTLHPAAYDRGVILAQTPAPGIPVPPDERSGTLLEKLAAEGAELLVNGLKQELHVPPYERVNRWWPTESAQSPPSSSSDESSSDHSNAPPDSSGSSQIALLDAPKLTKHHAWIDWRCRFWGTNKTLCPTGHLTASDIERMVRATNWAPSHDPSYKKQNGIRTHVLLNRALSSVRDRQAVTQGKRVILTHVKAVSCPPVLREMVHAIVQMRRALLLLSVPRDEDFGEDDHDGLVSSAQKSFSEALKLCSKADPRMQHLHSINWAFSEDRSNLSHESVRLPAMVHKSDMSITIPIGVPYRIVNGEVVLQADSEGTSPDALKILYAKVEGKDTRTAPVALQNFLDKLSTMEELSRDEFAIDVMSRRLD